MFGMGMSEIVVILAVALLVFGPDKLPQIAKSISKGLKELRRASDDLRSSVSMAVDDDEPKMKPKPRIAATAGTPDPRPASVDEPGGVHAHPGVVDDVTKASAFGAAAAIEGAHIDHAHDAAHLPATIPGSSLANALEAAPTLVTTRDAETAREPIVPRPVSGAVAHGSLDDGALTDDTIATPEPTREKTGG